MANLEDIKWAQLQFQLGSLFFPNSPLNSNQQVYMSTLYSADQLHESPILSEYDWSKAHGHARCSVQTHTNLFYSGVSVI